MNQDEDVNGSNGHDRRPSTSRIGQSARNRPRPRRRRSSQQQQHEQQQQDETSQSQQEEDLLMMKVVATRMEYLGIGTNARTNNDDEAEDGDSIQAKIPEPTHRLDATDNAEKAPRSTTIRSPAVCAVGAVQEKTRVQQSQLQTALGASAMHQRPGAYAVSPSFVSNNIDTDRNDAIAINHVTGSNYFILK